VYPSSTEEVRQLVVWANENDAPLYPVSRGRNVGYGERLPSCEGAVLVDLQRMSRIVGFDPASGIVRVQPGVTQAHLHEYLKTRGRGRWWMDATGAGCESSIIGNSIEAGFGHSPRGNRRRELRNLEVVLGNGQILETGTFPGLGPDLSGLFVQSNFGVVTAADFRLFPAPEAFWSAVITADDERDLEELVSRLRELRNEKILEGLVHVANPVRALMSTQRLPDRYRTRLMSQEAAREELSSWILQAGYWAGVAGLYGTKNQVAATGKELVRRLRGVARVVFFSDRRIRWLRRILGTSVLRGTGWTKLRRSLESYTPVHRLLRGIPSDYSVETIGWRVESPERLGLLWFSPTFAADGGATRFVVDTGSRMFARFGFEMPVTLTFVEPHRVVAVFSINFDRTNQEECERAHELHRCFGEALRAKGIAPYRLGAWEQSQCLYPSTMREPLKSMKAVFDPNGIIAPGRYGLS